MESKEFAKKMEQERKRKDRKWLNLLRNTKRWNAVELGVYRDACEEYAAQLKSFQNGKRVTGKGKDQTVVIMVGHPAEPSFNKIYKKYAKEAGLFKKHA